MVSTWSSGLTLQSTSYSSTENGKDLASNSGFTFKDFLPECRDPGGFFTTPVYETFRTLIDRANDWLQLNKNWKITTCESVEFKAKGEIVDSSRMTYLEYGEAATWYIRGLRLWLTERKNDREPVQQIGFLNLTPRQIGENGIFNSATYETLDDVLSRFNSMLQSNPLPGRVITVESQEMKVSNSHELEPDRSNWKEDGNFNKHFVFVIRIFYEVMAGNPEEIGIKDFVPESVAKGGIFTLPEYEPFSNVVNTASDWCLQQTGLRFCNAQSLEIKVKTGKDVDTQKMDYTEHGNKATFYVRILRVCYAKPPSNFNVYSDDIPPSISQLTCKTFVPVQLTTGIFVPEYETLSQTKERVTAWVRATGARVVSAETAALRILTGGEAKQGTEASFTFNQAERDEYWIFVIRLYLDGVYREPPLEMLPPVPDIESQSCCVIL